MVAGLSHDGSNERFARAGVKVWHDVKFEVLSSGNITPAWKLTNATVDQTGSLFSTSRDRTHDLLITMGPGDSTGLTGAAADADISQQITNGITTGLRNRSR
jgi:hypothetical protein